MIQMYSIQQQVECVILIVLEYVQYLKSDTM